MRVLVVSLSDNLTWPVVRSLAESGHDPMVLGMHRVSPFTVVPDCRAYMRFDEVRRTPSRRPDPTMVTDVQRFCRQHSIDVVMGADMAGVRLLADGAGRGGWNGTSIAMVPSTALIDELHDKWHFSARLSELGLPQPHTELVTTIDEVRAFGGRFPIVVKPRTMSNGVGLRVHQRPSEVDSDTISSMEALPGVDSLVVQEHFGDWDVGYSFLADRGHVVSGVLCRHRGRGRREFYRDERMDGVMATLLEATEYSGVGHVDARFDSATDRYALLELNPRFWASVLYVRTAGVNMPALLAQQTLGLPLGSTEARPGVVMLSPYERATTMLVRTSEALYARRSAASGAELSSTH
jgi:hypothetical protein